MHKYYISLPSAEAHHTTHPTGGIYGMAQKIHPKLVEKIHQLVSEGVIVASEMKRALDHYVKNDLCRNNPPDPNDRYIYRAKSKLQLSKFDQENLRLKISEWQKSVPTTLFFFRPFKKKDAKQVLKEIQNENQTETEKTVNEFDQSLLYIHQEKWQQDLMLKYGNTISLIDATYRTTKYELPLFFVSKRM